MDILILAALTFFIFYKLSKQLGRMDEEEKKQLEEKVIQMRVVQEQIIAQVRQQEKMVGASSTENKAEEKIISELDPATKDNLIPILQRCNITAEFFLTGANYAFEMLLKAFAAADIEVLKSLLAPNIFAGFEASINQRKAEEKIITTNLISIVEAKIISALMLDSEASITVKFVSKQINYITDKSGNILVGRKDEITEVTDVWTFRKNVTSPNPNWIISATNSN